MACITWAETGQTFDSEPGETVLDAAQRSGVDLPHDCRSGGCGSCRARVLQGKVQYEEMPFALSDEEAAQGLALLCQAHAIEDLVIALFEDMAQTPPQRLSGRVLVREALAPGVTRLQLNLDIDTLDYRPGQYLKILLPDGSSRSFSMATPPRGDLVELHIRQIPGGRFTEGVLPSLQPGDRLALEMPLGQFHYHPQDDRELLMVATGTGIAPLKAMLEALARDPGCPPVALYWGVRTEADLYLAQEITALSANFAEFRFVPVLSRAGATWTGRRGHVQDAVMEDHDDLSKYAIYLCGSPNMIDQARACFMQIGAVPRRMYADAFSFQALQPVPLDQ